jgi:hypothetical protein
MSGSELNSHPTVAQTNPAAVRIVRCMPQHILSTTRPGAALRILRRTAHHNTMEALKERGRSSSTRPTGALGRGSDSSCAASRHFCRSDSGAPRWSAMIQRRVLSPKTIHDEWIVLCHCDCRTLPTYESSMSPL